MEGEVFFLICLDGNQQNLHMLKGNLHHELMIFGQAAGLPQLAMKKLRKVNVKDEK